MVYLENEQLKIGIKKKGAELASVINKSNAIEFMWQADPSIWPWHAPNLFPIVGGCIENKLLIDGERYPIQRHGFARHMEFRIIESSQEHTILALPYDEDTLKAFPYQFEFHVRFDLKDQDLKVSYKVINQDDQTIWFSFGGHPAFNVPMKDGGRYDDYYIEFPGVDVLLSHQLNSDGLFNGQTREIPLNNNQLRLTKTLFEQDALVMKSIDVEKIWLKSDLHEMSIAVDVNNFNDLGIWAKPGADFICIEPWMGYADREGETVGIDEKAGTVQLQHGHIFERHFTLSFFG